MSFSDNVKTYRAAANLTQEQLAAHLDITAQL